MNRPCQCTRPGFCERYQRPMPGRLFELCQTRADYRGVWDRQCDPGLSPSRNGAVRFQSQLGDPVGAVVLGSFGLPRLIELQLRLIRDTCGPVPVLVADDCSPGFGEEAGPANHFALLQDICGRYSGVTLWPNVERIGHTGGDVAVFWKGLLWAAALGVPILAKLSQRFLIDQPRWLQEGGRELLRSELPLASRRCRGIENFDLRTEACLLDVRRWSRPEILARLLPRRYGPGQYAETVLSRALAEHLGGDFWPWDVCGEDRYQRWPGVVWHCADPVEAYQTLAERFGLTLDPDFTVCGWHGSPSYLHG